MISFIIPSYNAATWLAQAVKSVMAQTYKDCEVVIVDDCSTDSTGQYLDWLAKQKTNFPVKVVRNEVNLGRSYSRNLGNWNAKGDICVLDADDLATPKRAELTAQAFANGHKFVYGSAVIIDAVGKKIGELNAEVFSKEKALSEGVNRIVHSTIGYTKDTALNYLYKDGEISELGIDDWEHQVRMALDGVKFEMIPNTLCAYRQLASGISKVRDESKVMAFKKQYLESVKSVA